MDWLVVDWHSLLPGPWVHVLSAGVSLACGALVGFERERKDKPAGFRTMQLISLGAALFTMMSLEMSGRGDPGRIAAQVVTGIGFLGAGVILRDPRGSIHGITTAATIWSVAAVGMVAGAGYIPAALGGALLIYGVLSIGGRIEGRMLGACRSADCRVLFDPAKGKGRLRIEEVLDDHKIPPEERRYAPAEDGMQVLLIAYCRTHRQHREFLLRLADLPEVKLIETEGAGRA